MRAMTLFLFICLGTMGFRPGKMGTAEPGAKASPVAGIPMGIAAVAGIPMGITPVAGAGIPVDSMPLPPSDPKQLFYLQRTPNANTIICDLNDKDGVVDPENPIHVYWLRYTENQKGQRAELNYIQRTFAYGIKARLLSPDKYELHFVSYKKYSMYLERAADHRYHVFAMINGRVAILQRIFVEIRGGSFWTPHVEYVELKGLDPATGKEVMGRINV
jgi:hypothetical protein